PNGRPLEFKTTVKAQRQNNIHVGNGITEDEYVKMREARDARLDMPKLIIPSIQVNMKAGHLPEPEANGQRYLRVPLNGF
ncbi:MAG: MBL fold metallo-hydrolase, partial [Limnobacter sp.]|nr:MBL fold metallo-hydrolase [Limnobacter sp.]